MNAQLLKSIREVRKACGGATVEMLAQLCPDIPRSVIGKGLKEWDRFLARQEQMLRGEAVEGRDQPWELQALRISRERSDA